MLISCTSHILVSNIEVCMRNIYVFVPLYMDTTDPFIVGLAFLKLVGAILDINANIVMIGDAVIPATMKCNLSNEEVVICRVKLCRKTTYPTK